MADNFAMEITPFYKFSHNNNESGSGDSTNFENDGLSSESYDSENDSEVLDVEKQIVDHKLSLEQRLKELQSTMVALRRQLAEEKYMWKKQLDEVMQTTATACECQAGNLESEEYIDFLENSGSTDDIQTYSKEMAMCEYEEKLSKYQEALVKAQNEKKASLRRQISINNYKRRLLEVENMCNLELMRVKQNVQFLQPLQRMAQEWNKNINIDEEITGVQTQELSKNDCEISKSEEPSETTEKKFCNVYKNAM